MAARKLPSGVNHYGLSKKPYNDFSDGQYVFAANNAINCCKVNIAHYMRNIQVSLMKTKMNFLFSFACRTSLLLILFWSNTIVYADSSRKHLKIICLNVHGGVQDEDRYLRLIDFVKWQDPDILCLLELDGWEKNNFSKLRDFLSKTYFVDGVFEEVNGGHPLALFSKQKLAFRERLEAQMGLGLIHVKVNAGKESVDFYLTHLISKTADARTHELNRILNYVGRSEFTVLMGDFNSLSPNDPYDNEKLREILRKSGITEFAIDALKKDAVTRLLDSGFKDAAEILDVPFKPTVPTSLSQDKVYPTELRLDYIFLRGKIVSYLNRYDVIKTVETEFLSDHYPIVAEFEF